MKSVFSFRMKKILPILLVTLLIFNAASCEKDDICVDGDTPLLVIGFFDIDNPDEHKNVPSIRIKSIDNDQVLTDLEAFRFTDRSSSPDSLLVPLQISTDITQFEFITDSADDADTGEETGNIDTLTINYSTRETFISRACGFVANYDDLGVTLTTDASNWIQDITIVQQTVENSNNIHVKILY
ncbi:MAG: DUF6452 family protein [Allomuricauda sp.]